MLSKNLRSCGGSGVGCAGLQEALYDVMERPPSSPRATARDPMFFIGTNSISADGHVRQWAFTYAINHYAASQDLFEDLGNSLKDDIQKPQEWNRLSFSVNAPRAGTSKRRTPTRSCKTSRPTLGSTAIRLSQWTEQARLLVRPEPS